MNYKGGNSIKKGDSLIRWFTGESSARGRSLYAIIKCYMNYLIYLNYRVIEIIERGSLWHPADLKKSYKG